MLKGWGWWVPSLVTASPGHHGTLVRKDCGKMGNHHYTASLFAKFCFSCSGSGLCELRDPGTQGKNIRTEHASNSMILKVGVAAKLCRATETNRQIGHKMGMECSVN